MKLQVDPMEFHEIFAVLQGLRCSVASESQMFQHENQFLCKANTGTPDSV